MLDAMRQRHTCAATSSVILDYRQRAVDGEWIQADDFSASEIPNVRAVVRGANDIKEVAVLRDNSSVHTLRGDGERLEFDFREQVGEHYSYMRVEQLDGNVAWPSPTWVTTR